MQVSLPKSLRVEAPHRKCEAGIDLPGQFIEDLQAIDKGIYPVWHKYDVLWDDMINNYYGELEDPRYVINGDFNNLNFGFVLTDNEGAPLPDSHWHLWRYSWPHGWAHIVKLESTHESYLRLVVTRLNLQAEYTNKYGFKSWGRLQVELDEAQMQEAITRREDLFKATQDQNDWLMKRVMENFQRGIVKPTNPQIERINSFSGQKNKSRIVRPLDDYDKESGLYIP
jgi:hypothetical protein